MTSVAQNASHFALLICFPPVSVTLNVYGGQTFALVLKHRSGNAIYPISCSAVLVPQVVSSPQR